MPLSDAQVTANRLLKEMAKLYEVIWLDDIICRQDKCFTVLENTPIYTNGGHLSRVGAVLIGQKLGLYQRITDNEN
jgi:hypothetical protein